MNSWKHLCFFAGSPHWPFYSDKLCHIDLIFFFFFCGSHCLHLEHVIKPNDEVIKCKCDKVRGFGYLFGYRWQLLYVSHIHTSVSVFPFTDPSLAVTTLVFHWQMGCRKGHAPWWKSQAFSIIPCCDTWLVATEPHHMMEVVSSNRKLLDLLFLSRCFMAAPIFSTAFSILLLFFSFPF